MFRCGHVNRLTFRIGLDESWDIGDLVEKWEFALEKESGAARKVLFDLFHKALQGLANLICKVKHMQDHIYLIVLILVYIYGCQKISRPLVCNDIHKTEQRPLSLSVISFKAESEELTPFLTFIDYFLKRLQSARLSRSKKVER